MAWFTRQSRWEKATEPLRGHVPVPGKAAVKSGAVMAGTALAVTMASSVVSAARRKWSQS